MEYRIYRESDFRVSNWTGGKTRQLAIFPENASYLERNFLWRLSSATCEKEESQFTRLPDFDRVLLVLEGSVVLAHQDERVARLGELEQDRFDGAFSTKSFGRITDYNLMVAKGNQGFLDVVVPGQESRPVRLENYPDHEHRSVCFFCRDGFATVTVNGETVMVSADQQMVINSSNHEPLNISVMGEGHLIMAQIFYDYHPEELGPVVIPREKVSFDDFRTCVYLANVQFRGAKFIFRKLKNQWFDEELSGAIQKLERIYLPFLIWFFGLGGVAAIGVDSFSGIMWIVALLSWTAIDIFLISPLLYLIFVPKPVRKHIKDIHHLTPYEERVRERQLQENPRLDKLMKKYKNMSRISTDDEEEGDTP